MRNDIMVTNNNMGLMWKEIVMSQFYGTISAFPWRK
jgi:hypothetical protein